MGTFVLSSLLQRSPEFRAFTLARGRTSLHALPASVGIEHRHNETYSWDGLKRGETPFVVIQHTLSGRGNLEFEGRRIAMRPGQTMLVRAPHAHRYFLPENSHWQFFFLMLVGIEVVRLADEILASTGPLLELSSGAVDQLAQNYVSLVEVDGKKSGAASALAYQTMTIIYDEISPGQLNQPTFQPAWLIRVTDQIERQLHQQLPVERLAVLAGMSRGHFVRQFTRQTGFSPSNYIFHRRMVLAASLLQSGQLKISDIARRCGYAEPNYFAKAFRKAFDTSPSTFRQSGIYTSSRAVKPGGDANQVSGEAFIK